MSKCNQYDETCDCSECEIDREEEKAAGLRAPSGRGAYRPSASELLQSEIQSDRIAMFRAE